ncbi:LysR family transcriptional regulator [Fertoebacter nigrum]|uniref:LysR family transcriptional regulator n=1 Tax=Fertoeibacter niger TaxID=2656921 RepID=A0A8X8GZR7_9RHOB|nr:LysR substrate-binding domain-containing protein [Fertoeibacter niger]NUB42788.1 LysR family transcriptional regulator [Fertoeibacter niger]
MTEDFLRRGLKLAHLRIVAGLAETGQIGLAADRLGITQPAASRLLAEVERISGHAIHARTGRGVALTPEGQALARRAARVLMEIADAGRELSELAKGAGGHVRLGSVTGPAMDRVLPALRAARLSLPQVTVEVVVATSDILGDQLLAGRIDFAIARLPDRAAAGLFEIAMLASEPVSLMVRRGHRLMTAMPLVPADLMAFDWVMPGPDAILRRTVLARLRALGLPDPPGRVSTSSFLLTLALLQQTNAIAPLARAVAERFTADPGSPYGVLPLDLGIEVEPFGLIRRAGASLTPAAERILALILQPPEG